MAAIFWPKRKANWWWFCNEEMRTLRALLILFWRQVINNAGGMDLSCATKCTISKCSRMSTLLWFKSREESWLRSSEISSEQYPPRGCCWIDSIIAATLVLYCGKGMMISSKYLFRESEQRDERRSTYEERSKILADRRNWSWTVEQNVFQNVEQNANRHVPGRTERVLLKKLKGLDHLSSFWCFSKFESFLWSFLKKKGDGNADIGWRFRTGSFPRVFGVQQSNNLQFKMGEWHFLKVGGKQERINRLQLDRKLFWEAQKPFCSHPTFFFCTVFQCE